MDNNDKYAVSDSSENTYMSHICRHIFEKPNSQAGELAMVGQATCKDWFRKALNHCTDLVFAPSGFTFTGWKMPTFSNLKSMLFLESPDSSLSSVRSYAKADPLSLSRKTCTQLFVDVAKDYVNVAAKYSYCELSDDFFCKIVNNATIISVVVILMGLFLCVLAWKISRRWKRREEDELDEYEKAAILAKMLSASSKSLRTQIADRKHLQIVQKWCDSPTARIRLDQNALLQALAGLIKSQLEIVGLKNGNWIQEPVKEEAYLRHKLNSFFTRTRKCRIIIDYGIDSSSDSEEEIPKLMLLPKPWEVHVDASSEASTVEAKKRNTMRVRRRTGDSKPCVSKGLKAPKDLKVTKVPEVSKMPKMPKMPKVPEVSKMPKMPKVPEVSKMPKMPKVQKLAKMPKIPEVPKEVPSTSTAASESQPHLKRRKPRKRPEPEEKKKQPRFWNY